MFRPALYLLSVLAFTSLQCQPAVVGVVGPHHDGHDHGHDHDAAAGANDVVRISDPGRQLIGLKVEAATFQECRSTLKAMGKLLAPRTKMAMVGYAFPGRIAEIHVQIGDWVVKDQPLVTLESQEVGTAKSEFFKTVADLELATLNFEREKRLLDSGIGVEKNFAAAEAQLKIAQENQNAAHKRLHVLGFTEEQVAEAAEQHQVSSTVTLFAPISGKVTENHAVLGALTDQTTELLTIIDPTMLWADAQIYEKDIAKVRIGQQVETIVPAYPQEIFPGSVSYIGDVVDDETHTITVRAEVNNPDQRLKPGMFANVNIVLNGDAPTLVVPTTAVLEDREQKIVFVKHDDSFLPRQVETGINDGEHLQILSGLAAGEEVVTEGNLQLRSVLKGEVLKQAGHHH